MNPFKRMHDYFLEKSGKQRVLIVICLALLAIFVCFFIKGNFFDNKTKTHESGGNETSVSDTRYSEENSGETQTAQSNDVKFHINLLDFLILLVVVIFFVIHKIREKRRRM